jgi:hypothetical protein
MSKHIAVLDEDGNVMPTENFEQWARWIGSSPQRIIEQTDLAGGVWVSTVFLGVNYSTVSGGEPLWFETMVFGPDEATDSWTERCSTLAQAKEMHQKAILWVKSKS